MGERPESLAVDPQEDVVEEARFAVSRRVVEQWRRTGC
jgi:hypothetical protein